MMYGSSFNVKIPIYQYNKSDCGDKTILRLSYLNNGIFYPSKAVFLCWMIA